MARRREARKHRVKEMPPQTEELVWADALFGDADEIVAARGRESAGDDRAVVSMRCRRHRRRFNVEKRWLRVSKWLCPQCYEALGEEGRKRYAPRDRTSRPEVRDAEEGKPTMLPRKPRVVARSVAVLPKGREPVGGEVGKPARIPLKTSGLGKSAAERRKPGAAKDLPKARVVKPADVANVGCGNKVAREQSKDALGIVEVDEMPTSEGMGGLSNALRALLPPYRMKCKKCERTVPVHRDYLESASRFLCPCCYAEMGEMAAKRYSERFSEGDAELYKVRGEEARRKHAEAREKELERSKGFPTSALRGVGDAVIESGESDVIAAERACDDAFIAKCSPSELWGAVASGCVSKARARIELARRRRKEYYNLLPEALPVSVRF